MAIHSILQISAIMALTAFSSTTLAAPSALLVQRDTVYPDVIPGPGLPTLASLNITSSMLYQMGLPDKLLNPFKSSTDYVDKCWDGTCSITDAAAAFQYLNYLPSTVRCTTVAGRTVSLFVTAGTAYVFGQNVNPARNSTSSTCNQVSIAVRNSIENCKHGGKGVGGEAAAYANGDLRVVTSDGSF